MTALLSQGDIYEIRRYNGLKVFVESEQKRARYVGFIIAFREDNAETQEFNDPYMQVEVLKGLLKLHADELKTIIYQINPAATDVDLAVFLELVSRYFIDVADGYID